jgi:ferritin-like metal-binding protein YciE
MTDQVRIIKEAIARGKQRFFELHPHLLMESDAVIDGEAKVSGTGVGERQEIAKYRSIARVAKAAGKDSFLMLMELGSNSKEELDQLIAAQNAQIKRSIGI